MYAIDWFVVLGYLLLLAGIGLFAARRNKQSLTDFFTAGRQIPWWLAGISMAASTLSVDTPLYIAGIVGTRGIAGNWEWWCFGFAHAAMVYLFARLWRRSALVTDAELCELRYGGQMAAVLRGVKSFVYAVPLNCLGLGYALVAMAKVMLVLQLWQRLGFDTTDANTKLWSVTALCTLVLLYTGLSSLWQVVATDFVQFFVALLGSWVIAIASVNAVGGMPSLVIYFNSTSPEMLNILPWVWEGGFDWRAVAAIPSSTFLAYGLVQWWSFRRSDGGGIFVQHWLSARSEKDAEKASWLFNALHYGVRTWPWIVTALAAVVIYPDLIDRELGYPLLMVNYLPRFLLGIVVSSLLAAFLSTASTLINWGASHLANDIYRRFLSPAATDGELLWAGRMSALVMVVLGGVAAFVADDVGSLFRLVIALGTGPGLVQILRWFWWRINAAAELTAVVVGLVMGFVVSLTPIADTMTFGMRLWVITIVTTVAWVGVMLLTSPESEETLLQFYRQIRPAGPGWQRQQLQSGLPPAGLLGLDGKRAIASIILLFSSTFTVGGFLLYQTLLGWCSLVLSVLSATWLRTLNKQPNRPMGRPGLEDG